MDFAEFTDPQNTYPLYSSNAYYLLILEICSFCLKQIFDNSQNFISSKLNHPMVTQEEGSVKYVGSTCFGDNNHLKCLCY